MLEQKPCGGVMVAHPVSLNDERVASVKLGPIMGWEVRV